MVVRSPFPDVTIPEVPLTPYIFQHAQERADKPALIDGPSGRTLTYGQLTGAIQRAAAGLAARGFRKGEVFAIYCPNMPEYAVVFHAVLMLGGTVTTVNPLYTVRELADQLQDADARYLLTVPPFLANARAAAAQSSVRELFVLGEADVAVIGRPDTEAGEVPIAFAVIKRDVTARELLDFVAERVAPYKRLHDVAFVTQIPKSPTGKILRRVLIEQERAPRHTAYGG